MNVAVYKVSDKKCATCAWWQGQRGLEFRGNSPYYVKVEAVACPCMALKQPKTPVNVCPRWSRWEKL